MKDVYIFTYVPASVSTEGKLAGVELLIETFNKDIKFSIAGNKQTFRRLQEIIKEILEKEWIED